MDDTTQQPMPQSDEPMQQSASVEIMHGVILSAVLVVSSYLLGVTYWAVSYGQF